MSTIGVPAEIRKNKLKSVLLLASILAIFILLAYLVSRVLTPSYFFIIMSLAIVFSLAYVVLGYYNADRIALAAVHAKPATREHYGELHEIVERLCKKAKLPKPRLYIMQSPQINAFATGRSPEHAAICVTTGCLKKLSREELEGVLAHELSHIANFDIRFMTLTAVLVGLVSIVAQIFLRSLWFSSLDDRNERNGLLFIIAILLAILAPIATQLVQLAISRRREFLADTNAARLGEARGLRNALVKIKYDVAETPRRVVPALAPLFITNPFKKASMLLSTHPPIDARIKLLEQLSKA